MSYQRISAAAAALIAMGCSAATQRTTTVESGGEVANMPAVTPANNRTIPA